MRSDAASGTDMAGLKEPFCHAAGPMSPEVQQKWQKWGSCGGSGETVAEMGKMWQDTAGTTGGFSVLGQMSLPLQAVLIFPREKAERWMEAALGFDLWHYFDLEFPDFMVAADKIKY